jgi:hypothetical protein
MTSSRSSCDIPLTLVSLNLVCEWNTSDRLQYASRNTSTKRGPFFSKVMPESRFPWLSAHHPIPPSAGLASLTVSKHLELLL